MNSVPLSNAVLCVDCESISVSTHNRCQVCGSNSLFQLQRVLNGTLPPRPRNEKAKYKLEIAIKVSGATASELNQATQSVTRLLSSQLSGGWDSFHIEVEPVTGEGMKTTAMAA
jgi:hypothetical protein